MRHNTSSREYLLATFTAPKSTAVAHLRRLSAHAMDTWPPEVFLDYMVNRVLNQRLGTFPDAWNPEALLRQCGFECLVDCESVLAFGDAVGHDPGDVAIRIARADARRGGAAREEQILLVPQGQSMLAALRSMVKDEQVQLGNQHWGDQFDVQSLSSALNLGILMFCDELQLGGRQCLYNIGSQREAVSYTHLTLPTTPYV